MDVVPRELDGIHPPDNVQLSNGRSLNATVERALAAFDMFILHDRPGDVDELPTAIADSMHLDPYGTDEEVPKDTLLALLANFGWQANADIFLSSGQPRSLIMRLAHNIRATFTPDLSGPNQPEPYVPSFDTSRPASGSSVINRDSALLAFVWARLMLLPPNGLEWVDSLHRIFDRFTTSWIGDTWLVEKYICPIYDLTGPHGQVWDNPRNLVNTKRDQDNVPLRPRRRADAGAEVLYKVGQVFRHRRLNFLGVITGWADDGPAVAPEDTVMRAVDPSGERSVYYTCMRMDSMSQFKVLQRAILPVNDRSQIPDDLFETAGLYFKRFDEKMGMFISNIREEFPDD
ncbi:unnamed protein product [Parascedosporium putredinis]|uniref:Hemimethylated DNA-binding domain-containing protein n=1 Tax=Parascedosporium putredinis TaxID=1442378 RepID=A0A9P1M8X5_9PEZI|nr:unnamed protein product [Parascedosporium putredinis]CAI7994657.1 unnamed protein product [Parascedosporium putredinis]